MAKRYSKKFLAMLKAVTGKRSRAVVDHILKHGHVTTEELKNTYGYDHPPRAARDVREQGIPLETFTISGTHGRRIAAYRFADPRTARAGRIGGRSVFPKSLKPALVEMQGERCAICHTKYHSRYLQIDHRVPYEVAGDAPGEPDPAEFMLICGSCNRAKSWTCEHCPNWIEIRDVQLCETCYWASPITYTHVGLRLIRRLDVVWAEEEVENYDRLAQLAKQASEELPDFVKEVLRRHVDESL